METFARETHYVQLIHADVRNVYDQLPSPIVIISDGAYGINGFPGDLPTPKGLETWYEPHIAQWSKKATPQTTLWFWNTEIGWAIVHPLLEKYGWEYRACNIWNKGMAHVAGNSNTQSLRKLPIVSEVCVQYVKRASFQSDGQTLSIQEWLRYEWERTGLPFSKPMRRRGSKMPLLGNISLKITCGTSRRQKHSRR